MKIAACSSITSARRSRLTYMPINSRSTAAVDSRSSQSPIASSVNCEKFRAKARVDCARGPSLPSMLMGSPSTKPTAARSVAIAIRRAASSLNALRAMVLTPVASRRSGSDAATPMVLLPRSSPISAPRAGQCAAASISGRMRALIFSDARRSSRDDAIGVAQAGDKTVQRAVLMAGAALDEQGIDLCPGCIERMHADISSLVATLDHRARQQRDAHSGRDTADHAVERAQFKTGGGRPAEIRKHLFEPLAIGASGAEHERGRARFRRAVAQRGEACKAPRRDQHQLFTEGEARDEVAVLDGTCDKRSIERRVQHR